MINQITYPLMLISDKILILGLGMCIFIGIVLIIVPYEWDSYKRKSFLFNHEKYFRIGRIKIYKVRSIK